MSKTLCNISTVSLGELGKRIFGGVILMTIRETTIAKLQQLPESLVQEVNDFID
jgi:hypothetical protein